MLLASLGKNSKCHGFATLSMSAGGWAACDNNTLHFILVILFLLISDLVNVIRFLLQHDYLYLSHFKSLLSVYEGKDFAAFSGNWHLGTSILEKMRKARTPTSEICINFNPIHQKKIWHVFLAILYKDIDDKLLRKVHNFKLQLSTSKLHWIQQKQGKRNPSPKNNKKN